MLVQSSRGAANTGCEVCIIFYLDISREKKNYLGKTAQRERFGLEIANFAVHMRSLIGIDCKEDVLERTHECEEEIYALTVAGRKRIYSDAVLCPFSG